MLNLVLALLAGVITIAAPCTLPMLPILLGASVGQTSKARPVMIAVKPQKHGCAKCVSKGLDRDRAVDESGNQIGVFGRIGAKPLNADEQRRLYLHDGFPWKVSDDPRDPVYRNYRPPLPPARR